ncbi:hypothetical protein BT63DRAFT_457155 [Microthyrium microscopicum]|uniref:DUF1996 domain-containing protein n=1 Tax=Microthyrium microscopicum TaxID=703497 RepID=A0A6A6U882_9PEZI|nr:hypothetical protein BT63DRAFT_457155 [Microthyrium microscopicum]
MKLNSAIAIALATQSNAQQMLRFACSQLSVERLDPLVDPGVPQTAHLHQIVGGNAFKPTMPTTTDLSKVASCTTCTKQEDFSNYWTAVMYFRARNGTYKRVPQMPNLHLEGQKGGMTIYYIPPYDGKSKTTAFKPGFRMITGNPAARTKSVRPRELTFRCFGKNWSGDQGAPGGGSDTDTFPKKPCLGGIRSNTYFPVCWDGKNLDSPNHSSHMAYPSGQPNGGGPCPATHPVRVPQLFYETIWDTREFNNKEDWPADGSQPFVFSTGDNTGYGHHGDYMFGWKGDSLQRAMDARCGGNLGNYCPQLTNQTYAAANACNVKQTVSESVDGWVKTMPGGVLAGDNDHHL